MTGRAWEVRHGGALEHLKCLETASVQCAITSPPYYGLRSYLEAEHPLKPLELGAEAVHDCLGWTRGDWCGACYVCRMAAVFREVRRVLRPDGTLWLNLGDSYCTRPNGSIGASTLDGDHRAHAEYRRAHAQRSSFRRDRAPVGGTVHRAVPNLKHKDLIGIPWRVALALQADGWWLRMDHVWNKPNPMPESVRDRCTRSHEYLFLFAAGERYHYDAEAIAEPVVYGDHPRNGVPDLPPIQAPGQPVQAGITRRRRSGNKERKFRGDHGGVEGARAHQGFGVPWEDKDGLRNRRSVWTVATEPFPDAHFATFPQALVEPCILAGSRPGDLVLDPFAGSGTVGVVALRHGRRFLGFDLNAEYAAMARRRIAGPLFAGAGG